MCDIVTVKLEISFLFITVNILISLYMYQLDIHFPFEKYWTLNEASKWDDAGDDGGGDL
jgi:hypothetical protein